MRILLADSDAESRGSLADVLSRAGHAVSRASTGGEAFQLLYTRAHDVVILDRDLPPPGGAELCRSIRTQMGGHYLYTILIGCPAGRDGVLSDLRRGADADLARPVDPEELLLRVGVAQRILSLGSRHIAVFMMAKLAESRDPDTGEHLERMRTYSWLLAKRLAPDFPEVTEEFVNNIYHTSPLHDIGKVGIPDRILLKPGRLTEDEFEIMKTHTTLGADTLQVAMREYPEITYFYVAREIALSHHENYDGSGYPQGLRGREIPLSGRIVALADVYDALTSQRPYKRAFDHREAKGIILNHQARFDPLVLSAFFELEEEFLAVRDTLSEPPSSREEARIE